MPKYKTRVRIIVNDTKEESLLFSNLIKYTEIKWTSGKALSAKQPGKMHEDIFPYILILWVDNTLTWTETNALNARSTNNLITVKKYLTKFKLKEFLS